MADRSNRSLTNRETPQDAPKDSPEHLDPKVPPADAQPDPTDDREEQYIVHRTNVVNPETGAPEIKEHRVPLKDWAEYEKKHNL